MAKTKYQPENAEFSNLAHTCARQLIYPQIFNTDKLTFESTLVGNSKRNTIYDGEMGIDRIVYVTTKDDKLRAPIKFTIQERFRKIVYTKYRDLTITEWNHNSNLPSELYKISAGLFLYGYFDKDKLSFGETIVINTTNLLYQLALGRVKYSRRNNVKNQTFLTFLFDDLNPIFHVVKSDEFDIDWSLPTPTLVKKTGLNPGQIQKIRENKYNDTR